MIDQNMVDFFNYVQPIVNGCSGFIKTDGYMVHIPGVIIMMDPEETYCSIINIPIIYNVYITARINTFLSQKTPEDMSNQSNLYFIGWNIKNQHIMRYYSIFNGIENRSRCIFSEPDCYNINNFEDASSNSSIDFVNISDGYRNYRIPASKAITQLSKADSASLYIYDCAYDPSYSFVKTVRYSMYKKKFKLTVDVYSNIITV